MTLPTTSAWRALKPSLLGLALSLGAFTSGAQADQIQGTPGATSATRVLSGQQLPAPDLPFKGKIANIAQDSTPYWPATIVPPKGAPNVLLIMTDDAGYGVSSTFGGVIPTPSMDRIAANGLRYTDFNSTALCSPTRAALITGRNHHSVGFGVISEAATGYPGYDSMIDKDTATVGRILQDNGYHTAWFGKNHNTPAFQASQAGPFDQWPSGMGFEYFYGFIGGDTSQWQPNLFRNTTQIYPFEGKPGWNLTTAMADEAIDYMQRMHALTPDKPFFVYYVPGGTHAPHHATPEWISKISALHLFDGGWNQLRETIFANQKKLGVIPPNTKLTPWPKDLLPEWNSLSADQKKLYIRQVEVFAAYAAYTDHEIGRVIQAVEDLGKLDNTLIIYITGDNGTSSEGQQFGTPNEVAMFNGVQVPVELQLQKFYDLWGSDQTINHMAAGWAWAFDTPFTWVKQVASHLGGVRQGMAISWPARITDKGGIRTQFHHMIDIAPTILQAAGISAPKLVDGIAQKPIEGVSLLYTFDKANTNARSTHKTQYFEMMGDHALYHDGWIASTKVVRAPWNMTAKATDPMQMQWELYNLDEDYSQSTDLAAQYPDKLKQLQTMFMSEARKYQVLPLDTSVLPRMIAPRPSITAGRNEFSWSHPLIGTPNGDAPSVLNASYTFTAEVEIPAAGAEGMLITQGGRFAGYGFYVLKNKPVFLWNLIDLERIRWEGKDALTPGKHVLEFDFKYDGLGAATLAFNDFSGIGRGGMGTLKVDGQVVAQHQMAKSLPFTLAWDESLDIGSDTLTGVEDGDYQPPFTFTGKLNKVSLKIDRPELSKTDIAKLQQAQQAVDSGKE
ncbi:MAG: arylsulfatase [Pseudomonas sp.]|uniref:arylsulfatase n=1 Tax=Pseudomonas sp. TaxID=306 RepID=UPI003BB508BA